MNQGHEQLAVFNVEVSGGVGGLGPTGQVVVDANGKRACTTSLQAGVGSCHLTSSQLPVGTYKITASYQGDIYFLPSTSSSVSLGVEK